MSERRIQTVFVANRGEIAGRIAATAARLGIAAVIPPLDGPAAVNLLDPASVVAAARAGDADAVHPGYGFLAESPELARAVLDAGLAWIGPGPDAIGALGDKAEARAIARKAGVPVADGEEPEDQSDAALTAAAVRIGLPVLVKPAAGGGGKGIRVVRAPDEALPAFAAARREALRAFGDGRLLLERYIEDARHVEVQVLGDMHGGVVHLGDRDCSLQRRHQKLLEEAPAPGLERGIRRALWESSVRLAAAVGYRNAGTCEFLVAGDATFMFLEMNARLQVEHPVTELLLGRDLVADQLAIAAGATLHELGLDQESIEAGLAAGGHAVEVRLNAEDPAAGFLPSAGRVVALRWPEGAATFGPVGDSGVRVDAGVEAGDVVGGRFDPLLAKLIAHGPDRETALDRLAGALDATELLGLPTNLGYLRRLVRMPVVLEGRARTDTIESGAAAAEAVDGDTHGPPEAAWRTAAAMLADTVPGTWGGGWRLNGESRLQVDLTDPETPVRRVVPVADGIGPDAERGAGPDAERGAGPVGGSGGGFAARAGSLVHVSVDGRSLAFRLSPPPDLDAASGRGATGAASPAEIRAPMPGRVVGVHVEPGAEVELGARLATLEAMKMEHVVSAPAPGRVAEVLVREGEQVDRGQVVARMGLT